MLNLISKLARYTLIPIAAVIIIALLLLIAVSVIQEPVKAIAVISVGIFIVIKLI